MTDRSNIKKMFELAIGDILKPNADRNGYILTLPADVISAMAGGIPRGVSSGTLQLADGISHIKKVIPFRPDPFHNCDLGKNMIRLLYTLPWEPFRIRGKIMNREVCKFTPEDLEPYPFLTHMVVRGMASSKATTGRNILGVFCNFYKDGGNHTPYHQDSYGCNVLTISFGGSRDFLTKPVTGGACTKYNCEDGDVVVFTEKWNEQHKHSVPKRANADARISVVVFFE